MWTNWNAEAKKNSAQCDGRFDVLGVNWMMRNPMIEAVHAGTAAERGRDLVLCMQKLYEPPRWTRERDAVDRALVLERFTGFRCYSSTPSIASVESEQQPLPI